VYCPECGEDAGEAKFCPECGTDLQPAREARVDAPAAPQGGPRKHDDGRRVSPALLWAIIGVVAVAVVPVVLVFGRGVGGSGGSAATPIAADTSGSYRELVRRANGLYDQAKAAAQVNDMATGQRYGQAAATVYEAAWKKQPGDPAVGTDWATALFYAGEFDAAIQRADAVLAADPGFQKGWVNKGDLLWDLARMTQDQDQAAQYLAQAKTAYRRAVNLGPATKAGMSAAAQLESLK